MKTLIGKIISNKMQKTVVVEVERIIAHPLYNKRVRKSRKFHAHNELGGGVGDMVKMVEIKPMSKTKNWKVAEILGNKVEKEKVTKPAKVVRKVKKEKK